jgi:hypothetical protein
MTSSDIAEANDIAIAGESGTCHGHRQGQRQRNSSATSARCPFALSPIRSLRSSPKAGCLSACRVSAPPVRFVAPSESVRAPPYTRMFGPSPALPSWPGPTPRAAADFCPITPDVAAESAVRVAAGSDGHSPPFGSCSSARRFALPLPPDNPSRGCPCLRRVVVVKYMT